MTPGATTVECADVAATEEAGEALARRLGPASLVTLEGPLGVGKTVFVRGLARGLGHDPAAVSSPSFVLAIEHTAGETPLLHVDLYRLPEGSGLEELGVDDALDAGFVVAIEWGERLPGELERAAWRVLLAAPAAESPRRVTVVPPGAHSKR
jgi:tRNA threonylcarbamoyladenosine biosynthesis protein TsaE